MTPFTTLNYFSKCGDVLDRFYSGQRVICTSCVSVVGTYPLQAVLECKCGVGYRFLMDGWPDAWHTVNSRGMAVIPNG